MNKKEIEMYVVKLNTPLVNVMKKIDLNSNEVVFVVDENGKLCGAVTDGDIRRWIIKTGRLDVSAVDFMNKKPYYLIEGKEEAIIKYKNKFYMHALPVVNVKNEIVNILLINKKETIKTKDNLINIKVVIMAGGKGTRLYPYTKIFPKPLIPIGDVPIMERIIEQYCIYGIKDFFISVNYKKDMIKAYFKENEHDYRMNFIEEDVPLGTAGSLRLIKEVPAQPFFVTNCDILIQADYYDIYEYHIKSGNAITIVTSLKNDIIPYGVVYSAEDGEVIGLDEKPSRNYFVNTGMYVMNPEFIKMIPENKMFHMTNLVEEVMGHGFKVGMYPISEDSFLDMGEFDEMKRMEEKLRI